MPIIGEEKGELSDTQIYNSDKDSEEGANSSRSG
jgi:hypothetical protein